MVKQRSAPIPGLIIGGLLSANAVCAQTDCLLQFDANDQVDLTTLAETLNTCANSGDDALWYEIMDRGSYRFIYTAPEVVQGRQITGISHVDWASTVPMALGTVFGFRAIGVTDDDMAGQTVEIITHLPDGPDGPRPPQVTTKPIIPGALEAVLFLIGSEQFLIPGEWRIELRHRGRILAAQRFLLSDVARP